MVNLTVPASTPFELVTLSTGSEVLAAAVTVSDALASSCLHSMITKDFVNEERRREVAGLRTRRCTSLSKIFAR
jgi:hypothetical protein